MLHRNQVDMILIGRIGNNISKNYIKHHLYISDREHLRNRISHFSSHIAMQYMLDILFSCIFRIDYKENMDYIEEILTIVDDRDIEEN